MEAISSVLEWMQNLAFVLVGAWALLRWQRRGTDQGRWLAATFLSLSLVVIVGQLTEGLADSVLSDLVRKANIAVLGLFPYLLLRFLDSFEPVSPRLRRGVGIATAAVLAFALALPRLPGPDEPRGAVFQAFVVAFVGLWLVVLPLVSRRFWRAGRDQPTLVRRRLRTLSLATGALSLALLLAAVEARDAGVLELVIRLLGVSSALGFLVGLAPPRILKAAWRQPEEQRLHQASVRLMAATSPQQVADLLVPHVRDVIAARGVALVHGGRLMASSGVAQTEEVAMRRGRAVNSTTYELSDGAIHLWTNDYTPFFGEDELELLQRLAVLADLALARTALLASEQEARQELEAANAELESFVYSASHDLKSPLIAIQSYLDVLAEEAADALDEDSRWYVERMRSNCRYMESLVGDLLELSRVGRVETAPEHVDLTDLVGEIAAEVRNRHPGVTTHLGDVPDVWMNPLRCRQLFRNLVENAASHGGSDHLNIWIESQPAPDDGGRVVVVRDDGEGIPEAYRERIFGVFERLQAEDGERSNTGIGLAICRKIATSIGGHIWVTDHSQGAEFAVLFPPASLSDGTRNDNEVPA